MAGAAKRGFFGPMKTLDSAKTSIEELPDGRLRATIEHATMSGVEENIAAKHPVRAEATVTRFDDAAFNFELRLGGTLTMGVVDHYYVPTLYAHARGRGPGG